MRAVTSSLKFLSPSALLILPFTELYSRLQNSPHTVGIASPAGTESPVCKALQAVVAQVRLEALCPLQHSMGDVQSGIKWYPCLGQRISFLPSPFFKELRPKLPLSNCTPSSCLLLAKLSDKCPADWWLLKVFSSLGAGKASRLGVRINAFVVD